MPGNASSDIRATRAKIDKKRDLQDSIVEDAPENDGADRDLVHGEGGTLGLPSKPGDLTQDD
jgi:hypothetical protein